MGQAISSLRNPLQEPVEECGDVFESTEAVDNQFIHGYRSPFDAPSTSRNNTSSSSNEMLLSGLRRNPKPQVRFLQTPVLIEKAAKSILISAPVEQHVDSSSEDERPLSPLTRPSLRLGNHSPPPMSMRSVATRVQNQTTLANLHRKPTTTFLLFKMLPYEIQLLIWKYCRPDARIVILRPKTTLTSSGKPRKYTVDSAYMMGSVPSLLHTCRDSRTYALKHWYIHSHPNKINGWRDGLKYYFNPDIDAILLDVWDSFGIDEVDDPTRPETFALVNYSLVKFIRRVVVRSDNREYFMSIASRYRKAEEVILLKPGHADLEAEQTLDELEADNSATFEWQHGETIEAICRDRYNEANEMTQSINDMFYQRYQVALEKWNADSKTTTADGERSAKPREPPLTEPSAVPKVWVAKVRKSKLPDRLRKSVRFA